jgi:hypothetical protein
MPEDQKVDRQQGGSRQINTAGHSTPLTITSVQLNGTGRPVLVHRISVRDEEAVQQPHAMRPICAAASSEYTTNGASHPETLTWTRPKEQSGHAAARALTLAEPMAVNAFGASTPKRQSTATGGIGTHRAEQAPLSPHAVSLMIATALRARTRSISLCGKHAGRAQRADIPPSLRKFALRRLEGFNVRWPGE